MDGCVALWRCKGNVLEMVSTCYPAGDLEGSSKQPYKVWAAALHPLDDVFVNAGSDPAPTLYSTKSDSFGVQLSQIPVDGADEEAFAVSVRFNHDGSLFAVGLSTGTVLLFNTSKQTQLATITEHVQPVRALYFSLPHTSFADLLFVGSDDHSTTVHDLQGTDAMHLPRTITALHGHQGWILDIQAGGDGRILATCGSDATIQLWDLGASPISTIATFTQSTAVWSLAWKSDTSYLQSQEEISTQLLVPGSDFVTGSDDGVVRRYRNAGTSTDAKVDT
ncbi:Ski complex subunit Rec14 [Malassezia yamatoensis]|uniref:Ski complex subunit Rec14 n=1 Tax=Malassezia yamatoensis TaxID=253288 RepID=A0AAJ5YXF4_9BASI|nr:Ski complex subunit Rec14 [Malassezia yamatoensis]